MTRYNTLSMKLSNFEIRNGAEVTLKISSSVVVDSNNENYILHRNLLTNTQVSKLRKAFANGSVTNTKLSTTHLHKIVESGGFVGRLLGPLTKNWMAFNEKFIETTG